MLSRFVTSSTSEPRDAVVDEAATIEDVRVVVRLRGAAGIQELVVATELGGGVRIVPLERDRLPQRARAQLAFHEVAAGARTLDIAADALWVFDLQVLEQLPDAPGANDPLYLYGPLRGPYPQRLGEKVASVDGQLMVTRADLLGGLVDGVGTAFTYAPEEKGHRCIHALLPGERAEAIDGGTGIVLALPLAPAWNLDAVLPNDLVVAQLIYDVVSAVHIDLGMGETNLPVPSRAALEEKLVAQGWRIEGDQAVRPKSKSILGSVFGGSEKQQLPREGSLDELVAFARAALAKMANVPTAEAAAIARRAGRLATGPRIPQRLPLPAAPPPPPATKPSAVPRPRVHTPKSEWMKDFVEQHRVPSRPAPKVSTPARVVAPASTPAWMDDFAEPTKPETESKPPRDWKKDSD
jgi:hypothetical protein